MITIIRFCTCCGEVAWGGSCPACGSRESLCAKLPWWGQIPPGRWLPLAFWRRYYGAPYR